MALYGATAIFGLCTLAAHLCVMCSDPGIMTRDDTKDDTKDDENKMMVDHGN